MIYQGQNALVTTLKSKDIVALGQAIDSLNKEVIDIKFAVATETDFNLVYSAIVITNVDDIE